MKGPGSETNSGTQFEHDIDALYRPDDEQEEDEGEKEEEEQ
jgi:hypothetical protein